MLVHPLWTHSLHREHLELLLTPLRQTAQGCLPDFLRTSMSTTETWSYSCWQWALYFPCQPSVPWTWIHSSWVSGMSTRPSALIISLGTPVQNSHKSSSSTWMERALRHTKSHAKLLTVLAVYPLVTPGVHALGDTYSPFIETKAHHRTFPGTRSEAISNLRRQIRAVW